MDLREVRRRYYRPRIERARQRRQVQQLPIHRARCSALGCLQRAMSPSQHPNRLQAAFQWRPPSLQESLQAAPRLLPRRCVVRMEIGHQP
jgi:hypothetical protein